MIVPLSVYVFIVGAALIIAFAILGIIAAGRWLWSWGRSWVWALRLYYGKGKQ